MPTPDEKNNAEIVKNISSKILSSLGNPEFWQLSLRNNPNHNDHNGWQNDIGFKRFLEILSEKKDAEENADVAETIISLAKEAKENKTRDRNISLINDALRLAINSYLLFDWQQNKNSQSQDQNEENAKQAALYAMLAFSALSSFATASQGFRAGVKGHVAEELSMVFEKVIDRCICAIEEFNKNSDWNKIADQNRSTISAERKSHQHFKDQNAGKFRGAGSALNSFSIAAGSYVSGSRVLNESLSESAAICGVLSPIISTASKFLSSEAAQRRNKSVEKVIGDSKTRLEKSLFDMLIKAQQNFNQEEFLKNIQQSVFEVFLVEWEKYPKSPTLIQTIQEQPIGKTTAKALISLAKDILPYCADKAVKSAASAASFSASPSPSISLSSRKRVASEAVQKHSNV